jgi:hypothetical protein
MFFAKIRISKRCGQLTVRRAGRSQSGAEARAELVAGSNVVQRTAQILGGMTPPGASTTAIEPQDSWVELWTTGATDTLERAAQRWLVGTHRVRHVAIE